MKTETRTVFIADDGTEFATEAEARRHEHIARMTQTLRDGAACLQYQDALDAVLSLLAVGTFKFNK